MDNLKETLLVLIVLAVVIGFAGCVSYGKATDTGRGKLTVEGKKLGGTILTGYSKTPSLVGQWGATPHCEKKTIAFGETQNIVLSKKRHSLETKPQYSTHTVTVYRSETENRASIKVNNLLRTELEQGKVYNYEYGNLVAVEKISPSRVNLVVCGKDDLIYRGTK